jgi:hypothetical protein
MESAADDSDLWWAAQRRALIGRAAAVGFAQRDGARSWTPARSRLTMLEMAEHPCRDAPRPALPCVCHCRQSRCCAMT